MNLLKEYSNLLNNINQTKRHIVYKQFNIILKEGFKFISNEFKNNVMFIKCFNLNYMFILTLKTDKPLELTVISDDQTYIIKGAYDILIQLNIKLDNNILEKFIYDLI